MKVKAAIAIEKGKSLIIDHVDLEGPKKGEVLVEIKSTGVCHTDAFTLSGADPEGIFPSILGHEGAGVVVDVGEGVESLKKDDHVIPLYTPECRACKFCLSGKTNLCQSIRETQGKGLMPDGTSRFSYNGKVIYHYMGTSTFSNYTVLPEIALAKIRNDAPPNKVCYIGCGVTTGIGAVLNTAKMESGANAVVFGLGGIGLNVIQGCKMSKAKIILGIDINTDRENLGKKFGMTDFLNPKELKEKGLAHVPEDRQRMGLITNFKANENLIFGYHHQRPFSKASILVEKKIYEHSKKIMSDYDVRPQSPDLITSNFSGGNQQKIILSRELNKNPKVLLVGQPTRGIDIGAIEFIHQRLIDMRNKGVAILLVSVELEEVLSLSDRIVVMFDGKIVGEKINQDVTEREIGLLMAGTL